MKKSLLFTSIFLGSILTTTASLAVSQSGVLFLMIAPGARASGMGEGFVAVADDATASYWNPAGLGFQRGTEVALMHSKWFPEFTSDMYYDFVCWSSFWEGVGTLGGHIIYFSYGNMPLTSEYGPDILSWHHSYEVAMAGSFGAPVSQHISAGVSLKAIYSDLGPGQNVERGDGKAMSYAVDVGILARDPVPRLNLGAMVQNIGPDIMYVDADQSSPLPRNLKVGASYRLFGSSYNELMLSSELDLSLVRGLERGEWEWWGNLGSEYWYAQLLALRAGYLYDKYGEIKTATFGAGLRYNIFRFDFGYVTAREGHPLADTMRFSLAVKF
ncbi:MAG: hypothetical protein AMJ92_01835 [candidate division Zixibacteria bacterium SM23_81]|nr:MAG: hypothetical protein AMJ92_01835 [candidate division Zixibacteria bacterium SM23_81]